MKAKINGIEVEGTPQEIHELMVAMGPVKLTLGDTKGTLTDQTGVFVKIPTGNSNNAEGKKCKSPCYCTGACTNSALSGISAAFDILASGKSSYYDAKYYK